LVIGAGPATFSMHLPVLARLRKAGAIELAIICDIVQGRAVLAKHKFGFAEDSGDAYACLQRPDIDLTYIFADAMSHHEYGIQAINAGKHVFVEKPIAPSFALAREMAAAARSNGVVAVGGHNRRFFSSLVAARDHAGKAGWRGAEAVFHKNEFGKPPPFGARSWLSANGIHALDAMVFMMGGLPEHLMAEADGVHIFHALMRWPGGRRGVFVCDNSAGARREEYVFRAPGGSCRVNETAMVLERNGTAATTSFNAFNDGLLAEHEAFLRAVRDGGEPQHSLAVLAPSLFLAEQIEEGFSGHLKLPPSAPHAAPRPAPASGTILLVEGADLLGPLARLAPGFRLISPEEIRRQAAPRPDVVAALLGRNASPLSTAILDKLPNLTVLGFAGLSLSHLEPRTLLGRGIDLLHASEAYADSVAEFALALAILGRRRAFLSHDIMRRGGWGTDPGMHGIAGLLRRTARKLRPSLRIAGLESLVLSAWRKTKPLLTTVPAGAGIPRDLKGATAGLIGWSANARAFALRLAAAGVRVLVWSEHAQPDGDATSVSLAEALAADIVSLHRGLTQATRHFLGAAELAQLRPGAVLINVARGALVDPDALFERLRRGDIFACLDTYDDEPLFSADALRRLPNVFLTSHIAGGAPDMHAKAAEEIVAKLAAYLRGGDTLIVTAERLATMT
jgi:phosphoglycerate dehydrogenase-like enzyme/predicted dehydrogenase